MLQGEPTIGARMRVAASSLMFAVLVAVPRLAVARPLVAADRVIRQDLEKTDRLAKCSAACVTQYRILEAGGQKDARWQNASVKFYDAAVARSSKEHTAARFTVHYKVYLALTVAVEKAEEGAPRQAAARKLMETLNAEFDACDALRKTLEPEPKKG
jgi:hypothetical protein